MLVTSPAHGGAVSLAAKKFLSPSARERRSENADAKRAGGKVVTPVGVCRRLVRSGTVSKSLSVLCIDAAARRGVLSL